MFIDNLRLVIERYRENYIIFQLYYRQKGSRAVTRPQALQETFEQCSDVVVQKLQSYYQQSDEYHNQCLQGRCITCLS